jgi:signal transduction histidine kinase
VAFELGHEFLAELKGMTRNDFLWADSPSGSTLTDTTFASEVSAASAAGIRAQLKNPRSGERYFVHALPIANAGGTRVTDLLVVCGVETLERFQRRVLGAILTSFLIIASAGFLVSFLSSKRLSAKVNRLLSALQESRESNEKQKELSAIGELASQVAHDIRSPLAALDSVTRDLSHLPEDKRIIIRSATGRIRDIANHLIEKYRQAQASSKGLALPYEGTASEPASLELLSSLIDPLVTEKRLQFRSKIGIEIEAHIDTSSYGLFGNIQPGEFKRAISNLINNGVEALGEQGIVTVSMASRDGRILIRVQDNGKGIPPDLLAKLGLRGQTYDKQGGSGLGLYHARASAESWGGSLDIESAVGQGTSLIMSLPQAAAPDWFVSKLDINPGGTVVILDDDTSIHQVWQGRFDRLEAKTRRIEILHFSTPNELRDFVSERPAEARSALYLMDFELLACKETGLALIESLRLGERSILVTSRFEERSILSECRRLKVRMIPKGLAAFVPISIHQKPDQTTRLHSITTKSVLLDDDALVRMNWTLAAKANGLSFSAFADPIQLLNVLKEWPRETRIYLDSHLGNGARGEEIAKNLHGMGFTHLFLATGYDKDSLPPMPWIKEVVGKEPPW